MNRVATKNGIISKGYNGEYHVDGGMLNDAIFFLKPNNHGCYTREDFRWITLTCEALPTLSIRMEIDECNPLDSLLIFPCVN
jgi:hypothetical protein